MKKSVYLTTLIIGIIMTGCSSIREKTAEELLDNPEMEEKIFAAILKNNAHLSKLMDKMMLDENCKKKMTGNSSMMKMMFMSELMDSLINIDEEMMGNMTNDMMKRMSSDKALCDKTCTKMMGNEYFAECVKEHNCIETSKKFKLKK